MGYTYTKEDQLNSLKNASVDKVGRLVKRHLNSENPEYLSPKLYLSKHNVIFAAGPSTKGIVPNFETSRSQLNYHYKIAWPNDVTAKQVSGGAGAPISDDGYILTAFHCVDKPSIWAFFTTTENEISTSSSMARCRIVFADKDADFAIVKAPTQTPYFLNLRKEPLVKGEVLLAGSTINHHGGGKFLWSRRSTGQTGRDFISITTSIPMKSGDSGSAVVDNQGRLCGVVTSAMRGRWISNSAPRSDAVMLKIETIQQIIEEDRRVDQTSAAHNSLAQIR